MVEQNATVIAVRDGNAVVETVPESSCNSCSVKAGCGTSVLSRTVGRKVIHFEIANTVDAGVGDRVVLGLPEDAIVKGSLLMYLLPLLLMFALALLADYLLPAEAALRDLKIAATALLGLVASIGLDRLVIRRDAGHYTPVMLRKHLPLEPAA